jgi:hypothetical protein
MADDASREIPDYVEAYLVQRILSLLPDEVIEALASLTPEQVKGLELLGEALDAADAEPYLYVFGVH